MNKIPIMPTLHRWIEVRDWWCGSYERNGKWYVDAELSFNDVRDHVWSDKEYVYWLVLSFWGNDDTGIMTKNCGFNDVEEAYKEYKRLRKFLNHLQKMKPLDLQRFLFDSHIEFMWG